MLRLLTCILVGAVVSALVLGSAAPAHCRDLESEALMMYAVAHPFGLASATTTRQFAMGGHVSCVWERGFANPAFAALQPEPNAGVRYSATSFDAGPSLNTLHAHYVHPLPEDAGGLQLSIFRLRSGSGTVAAPAPLVGNVTVKLSEDDLALHYGRRLAPGWTAGISLTPYSRIKLSMTHPLIVEPLLDVEAKPDIGARLGVTHEWAPGSFAGLVFDRYRETARGRSVMFGDDRARRTYNSEWLAVGVSHRVGAQWLGAVEYSNARTFKGPLKESLSGWRLGAEYRPVGLPYAVRAGLNDKRPTLGLGYEDRQWQVDYAFMSRWNDDIAGGQFGGSDTHQVQATYHW